MKRVSYLNVILTINAVLLAVVLLVLSSGSSMGPSEASAQVGMAGTGSGIPNAAAQRQRMIESLDRLESSVVELRRSVESGRTRVEVVNLDDIQIKSD